MMRTRRDRAPVSKAYARGGASSTSKKGEDSVLEVDSLHAGYGTTEILHGVSVEVRKGEVIALLGPNGAGKSTLLRTVSGMLAASMGTVRLNGLPVTDMHSHKIAAMGVAHVVEGRGILPNLTVRENIQMGAFLKPRGQRPNLQDCIDEAVASFPWIQNRLNDLGGKLSGGEQQMVAISRAMAGSPKLLLLDEPSLGLAPMMVHEVFTTIRELATADRAILMVEQHIYRALKIASRAYVIQRGHIVLTDDAEALEGDGRVEGAYFS